MKYQVLCLFIFIVIHAGAQQREIDSLRKLVPAEGKKTDTVRANKLLAIANIYRNFNYDSAIYYARLALDDYGEKNPDGQSKCYVVAGIALRFKGNYTMAIEFLLKAFKIAEKNELSGDMYRSLQTISTIYKDMRDYQQAFDYGHRARQLAEFTPEGVLFANANLGDLHQRNNHPDSALYYENIAYEYSDKIGSDYTKSFTLETLGDIQESLGNPDLARRYFHLSRYHAAASNSFRELTEASNSLAALFMRNKQPDSSYFYAQEAMHSARTASYKLGEISAFVILQEYFETKNQLDSALFYYKLGAKNRQELMDEEKIREIQNLQFNEQLRLQEKAKAESLEKQQRLFYIQIFAIALFIAIFFTIVLTLSRRKINANLIEFLSIISLLLLFEFINLILHPIVGSFTHHNPIWMLLILVGIAAFLVPLHHKMEHWLKKKIGKKQL